MKKILLCSLLFILIFLTACTKGQKEYQVEVDDMLKENLIDDNYRVFYQIFIGSFSDSNNDGIGDLQGIINRLDYLNDGIPNSGKSLGIEGIWLSPMMPSPSYHKYDVTNYYEIDSIFGDLETFKELIRITQDRNIKVIIDLVVNHTSEWHPWFRAFKKAIEENDMESPYREYYSYVTANERDLNKIYYQVHSGSDYYYEANFSSSMPELNFDNPSVREAFKDIIEFWLNLGVSGFRLDATKYVYMHETEKNIEFWNWFMDEAKKINPDVYVIGETWSSQNEMLPYYEPFNNFDFEFSQLQGLISQAAMVSMSVNSFTKALETYQNKVMDIRSDAILSPFISNHDMDRSAGYLSVEDGIMQMAANFLLLSPGNPYIYYGEEIGLKGSRGNANTDANRRLAMLWGDNDKISDPVGTTYPDASQTSNTVKKSLSDETSLYNHYKKLIMLRKANPEIARGIYVALNYSERDTFGGSLSTYNGSTIAIFHNSGIRELVIDLNLYTDIQFQTLRGYVGQGDATLSDDGHTLTISGQTSVVLK